MKLQTSTAQNIACLLGLQALLFAGIECARPNRMQHHKLSMGSTYPRSSFDPRRSLCILLMELVPCRTSSLDSCQRGCVCQRRHPSCEPLARTASETHEKAATARLLSIVRRKLSECLQRQCSNANDSVLEPSNLRKRFQSCCTGLPGLPALIADASL